VADSVTPFFLIKDDPMSTSNECLRVLKLSAVAGLGLKYFHRLYSAFGSINEIYDATALAMREAGLAYRVISGVERMRSASIEVVLGDYLDTLLEWEQGRDDRYVLCLEDALYPSLLREISCPPPIVYVEGQLETFLQPAIAVVGSRKSTLKGIQHAQSLSAALAKHGCCVTSGLALGIDAAAHRGALQAQGLTCGVLATGLDLVYPRQHQALAEQVKSSGLLLSEMKLGTKPVPGNFPRRNRLISGMSHGVLVVEAGLKSGSLITAKYALEQNREIFAIPGSIDSLVSKGCHALIKQGAKLVENIDDILEEFSEMSCVPNIEAVAAGLSVVASLSVDEELLMEKMGHDLISFDELISVTGLNTMQLSQFLIELELKRLVALVPGGYQRMNTVKL